MPYFWYSNWHYFGYISGKVAKPHFLESPQESLKIRQNSYQWDHPLRNNGPLKIWNICVFWRLLFQKTNCWNLEFLMNQIFGQRLIIFENWDIWVNYCWNYGLSKLLLQFIEYRLDQLNNKHTKIAVNSAIQYFEGCSENKCLLKVWNFLVHLTSKWQPCKVFAKLNGNHLLMINFFKLHEY